MEHPVQKENIYCMPNFAYLSLQVCMRIIAGRFWAWGGNKLPSSRSNIQKIWSYFDVCHVWYPKMQSNGRGKERMTQAWRWMRGGWRTYVTTICKQKASRRTNRWVQSWFSLYTEDKQKFKFLNTQKFLSTKLFVFYGYSSKRTKNFLRSVGKCMKKERH